MLTLKCCGVCSKEHGDDEGSTANSINDSRPTRVNQYELTGKGMGERSGEPRTEEPEALAFTDLHGPDSADGPNVRLIPGASLRPWVVRPSSHPPRIDSDLRKRNGVLTRRAPAIGALELGA